ncbi:MAG: PAS domain S-box protein [Promethearchaeota archaeon]
MINNNIKFSGFDINDSLVILKSAIECFPFDVFVINSDGYYTMQNSACKRNWGDIIGKRPEDVANNEETLNIWNNNNKRAFAGETVTGEVSFKLKEGKRHFYNIISPIYIDNKVQYIIGINIDITEKIEAKQKLFESQSQHREMLENLDVGFFRVSLDGIILTHNRKYNEIFGIDPTKQLNGEKTFDFWVNQKDREEFLKELKKYGKVKNYITYAKKIDGETIVLQGNSHLIRDINGKPLATEGTIIDITEKHTLQLQLKESEEEYRSLFENAPIALMDQDYSELKKYVEYLKTSGIVDFDKYLNDYPEEVFNFMTKVRVVDVNQMVLEIYKTKNKEEFISEMNKLGENTHNKMSEEVISENKKMFLSLIKGNKIYDSEFATKTDTGEIVYLYGKTSIMAGFESTWSKVIVSLLDITDKKLTEQKLIESEEKFRTIADQSLLGIAILQDNKFKYINRKFANLSGRTIEEVKGWDPFDLINIMHPEDKEIVIEYTKKRQLGISSKASSYECRALKKNGDLMWVQSYSNTITFNGKPADLITITDITDKKIAEQKLKESEGKFRTITEQSFMGIFILQEGVFKYTNQTLSNIIGYSLDEILKWSENQVLEKIHPNDVLKISETYNLNVKGEPIDKKASQFRFKQKEGSYIWLETFSKRIEYENKPATLTSVVNISEKKLSEQKLKESEEKFRTIAEQSLMGICIIQDFEIKYINQQMADIYEYPLSEINKWKPKEFIKVIHPESRNMALNQLSKKQQGLSDTTTHYIVKIITKTGKIKYVENYSKSITFRGWPADLLTQIDITSKMTAENKVRESEEKYHHLYENSPFAIVLIDTKGIILDCNLATEDLSGFKRDQLVGVNLFNSSFIPNENIYAVIKGFKKLLKKRSLYGNEIQFFTKDKRLMWISYQASMITIENQHIIQVIIENIDERKKAEERLKDSENKYHKLFETSPDGVVLTDLNGIIIECNSAIESITGYSVKEFIGKNFMELDLYLQDGLNQLKIGYKDLFEDNLLEAIEFPIITKDNYKKWVQISGTLLHLKRKSFIIAVIHEITNLKQVEEAIKENEKKFHDILETSSVGIMELDVTNKNLLYINPKLLDIIGFKKDEITEDLFRNFIINPKDLNKLLITNDEAELEFRITDKLGKIKWLAGKRIPHYNENNEVVSIRVWLDDITEKKMYENLIYELNINFLNFSADIRKNIDLLLETCLKLLEGDLVLYIHKKNSTDREEYQVITLDNSFICDEEEFYNLFVSALFQEEHDFPQTFFDIDQMIYNTSDPFIKEHKFKAGFGKVIKSHEGLNSAVCIFYKKNPILSGQDKLVLFLICDALEIEQRRWQVQKDLEKQNITLNKINKLKSELFSRTSHELKTPLISIKGFTELLLTLHKSKLDDEIISILKEIKEGSKRLEKIINLLLESTKLEAGQLDLNLAKEDLSFLIKFCVKELKGLAELRNQTIDIKIHDKLECQFDKERIYEVISNLLVNSIKYTPPGGKISIESKIGDSFYLISVKDNGIGFTNDEIDKAFKQFGKIERYGQGWDVAIEGTGLGLYITKKLVELHGGKIWLESEGRNKGSCFYFTIPVAN